MRIIFLVLALVAALSASAQELTARIRSARPFGYFVGDLIHARVDVSGPENAALSRASLPKPGPLTGSLDLRDVKLSESVENGARLWRLDLTYQNFYVALDARDIEIPSFDLAVSMAAGAETVKIPAWRVGVSPLREVAPQKQEEATDYMRPDGSAPFVDEATPRNLAIGAGVAALLAFAVVARDRAWPPFQQRRARVFSALANEFSKRRAGDDGELDAAIQSVHRALDTTNGVTLLAADLPDFLRRRPEFVPLRMDFERFFSASKRRFFGGERLGDDFRAAQLAQFVSALARRERSG
ncbi:MAG: nonribosomal peptide synthetase MxaA [Alphaproteobacteria bacterium]|nr:nonribosomal peptide synthetase MxaA [Alphaproteobacteria bacterium]MBM3651490.1 nonribosomal peptide synthetase MxaA [Alphaproteobacteria bacterium]